MPFSRAATVAAFLFSLAVSSGAAAATVRGVVSGPGGTRLGGMVVEAYDTAGFLRGTATTDSAGTYVLSIAAGQYRVLAYDALGTYATTFWQQAESFETSAPINVTESASFQADFTLVLGATINGSVAGGTTPLANAVVEVYNLSGSRRGFTRTNASGQFSLVVPAGDYKLYAYDASGFYAGEFHSNGRTFVEAQSVRATAGAVQSVPFTLDRAAHAAGRVIDAVTRLGLPGIVVDAYTPDGQLAGRVVTDAQGRFTFALQGGRYRFVAGDPARTYAPAFWNGVNSFARAETITLVAGVDRNDITLATDRAAVIQGRVTNPSSLVVAYNLDGTVHAQTAADASGAYSLLVAPGAYKIAAVPLANRATQFYGATPDFDSANVVIVSGGQSLTINFDPPRAGRVTGAVRDATTQQALGGMTVVAYDANGLRVAESTTLANGQYTLLVAPGAYRLLVFDPRLDYATSYAPDTRTVAVDATTTHDFTMRRGTRVSGSVRQGNDAPVAGAEVLVFDLAGNSAGGATTGADGTFTLVVLPGTYSFTARTRFSSATVTPVAVGAFSPGPVGFVLDGVTRRRSARH
ncbi:MAG TPA: carboxypeptidase-like regulatory domain-containing protein [Thermoanaerobaculia bacterium]|nr:carboxypeptidase-like regulatory domain-containing protein [Thermoanaerobaculia bacterium]